MSSSGLLLPGGGRNPGGSRGRCGGRARGAGGENGAEGGENATQRGEEPRVRHVRANAESRRDHLGVVAADDAAARGSADAAEPPRPSRPRIALCPTTASSARSTTRSTRTTSSSRSSSATRRSRSGRHLDGEGAQGGDAERMGRTEGPEARARRRVRAGAAVDDHLLSTLNIVFKATGHSAEGAAAYASAFEQDRRTRSWRVALRRVSASAKPRRSS